MKINEGKIKINIQEIQTLGERIKYFRQRANLTQIELELMIDVSFGSISRIENNITNPNKETLLLIANAINLNSIETASLFGIEIEIAQDTANL